jgi:hypothetical protein
MSAFEWRVDIVFSDRRRKGFVGVTDIPAHGVEIDVLIVFIAKRDAVVYP